MCTERYQLSFGSSMNLLIEWYFKTYDKTSNRESTTMISGASLEKVFWREVVLTATILINLTPTKHLK